MVARKRERFLLLSVFLLVLLLGALPVDGSKRNHKKSKRVMSTGQSERSCAKVQFLLGAVSCENFLAEVSPPTESLQVMAVAPGDVWWHAVLGDQATSHPRDLGEGGASLSQQRPAVVAKVLANESECRTRVRYSVHVHHALYPSPTALMTTGR